MKTFSRFRLGLPLAAALFATAPLVSVGCSSSQGGSSQGGSSQGGSSQRAAESSESQPPDTESTLPELVDDEAARANEEPSLQGQAVVEGRRTYLGEVARTDARVGVVVEGDYVAIFFCGGPSTYATHTKWIRGTARFDGSIATVTAGGWTVLLRGNGSRVIGRAYPGDGTSLRFSARLAPVGAAQDLYDDRTDSHIAGVIVADLDGDGALESQGVVSDNRTGRLDQIIVLRTSGNLEEGLPVSIPFDGGTGTILVHPARAQVQTQP